MSRMEIKHVETRDPKISTAIILMVSIVSWGWRELSSLLFVVKIDFEVIVSGTLRLACVLNGETKSLDQ